MIKRKKIDVTLEKSILTAMIVSDRFLKDIIPIYSSDLFEISFGPIVANWCKSYFDTYKKAPSAEIQDIFDQWKRKDPDPDQVEYIEEFLAKLSEEYEYADKINVEYLIDKTIKHFKAQSLRLLASDINANLSQNNIEEAEQALNSFKVVEKLVTPGIDPFETEETVLRAFEEQEEPLFKLPGELGKHLNTQFTRDSYIILAGPEKRGKSFWLIYFAMQAQRCRCNVAFFSVGDMSELQVVKRMAISIAKKSDKRKYCGELLIPVLDCEYNQKDTCTKRYRTCKTGCYDEDGELLDFHEAKGYKPCTYCSKPPLLKDFKGASWYQKRDAVTPLTGHEAYRTMQTYKKKVRAKAFKLSTHPNSSVNVSDIDRVLDSWERLEGFVPDVIVIDYQDILKKEREATAENRHDETGKALRRLSQERHCCVITATQTNRASYFVKNITSEHIADDKRKLAHATAVYALNQEPAEKRKGVMRIGPMVIREDSYDIDEQVTILQCLQIGSPYIASY